MKKHIAWIAAASALAVTPRSPPVRRRRKALSMRTVARSEKRRQRCTPCSTQQGADPMALDFYKMMLTADFGAAIMSITPVDLTADDLKRLEDGKSPMGAR